MNNFMLKKEEETIFRLRNLYQSYGYSQYKMSKFEEYDLYLRNKDFLISDGIITFTDTNGKLLALKPDVTLSIIKNFRQEAGLVQKTYYNENVYRVSNGTHTFKELMQVGIECMGDVDDYALYEVLFLAAESLRLISDVSVLDVSHFGIVSDLIDSFGVGIGEKKEILSAVGEKNLHEVQRICDRIHVEKKMISVLKELISLYGKPADVFPRLEKLLDGITPKEDLHQLKYLCERLASCGYQDMVRVDFSVVDDVNYYNGIIFKGFVKTVPTRVLSGGQYNRLMRKMNRNAGAVGFAIYFDLLEELFQSPREYDIDAVLLYSAGSDLERLSSALNLLVSQGKTVTAQKKVPEKITYRQLYRLTESGVELVERNA